MGSAVGITPTHPSNEGIVNGTLGCIGAEELFGDGKEGDDVIDNSLAGAKVGFGEGINGASSQ